MNVSQIIAPGNGTYASATKYGKKAIVIGDSHLWMIDRKLFNESLPNCSCLIKYFSGVKGLELEHYMKPTLNNNLPDAVTFINSIFIFNWLYSSCLTKNCISKCLSGNNINESTKLSNNSGSVLSL